MEWDEADLEFKLLPENMTATLLRSPMLLTGWEFIRSDIIEGVRGFFVAGWDKSDAEVLDPDYQQHVASKVVKGSVTIFDASVAWLVEMEALTSDDVKLLRRVREHRNEVAHELAKYLVDPSADVSIELLFEVRDVIRRLGQFWGRIAVATNKEFDGQEIAPEDIRSGSSLLFDFILSLTNLEREGR
jgi:hypothetical protein